MRALRDPLLIVILVLSLILGVAVLDRGHDWGDDFASYIMQAKSIWTGTTQEFVEHNRFTIEEFSIQIGPVAYPWCYPLILVPAYALKGNSALTLKLPGIFLFLGFLVCLFLIAKDRLTRTESLLLVSLFAFNPLLTHFHNQILSDIPFLFFSTLSLWLMLQDDRRKSLNALILGAVIAGAFFIRTQGILLLASYGALELFHLWTNRKDRETVKKIVWGFVWVCVSFGLLWLIYALIFPGGGESYFNQYKDFQIGRAISFTIAYFRVFSEFFGGSSVWNYVYYFSFLLFLIGLWVRRKEEMIFIVFFVIWMLLLLTWPAWQGPRFIFPLFPIYVYFVFQGIRFVIQKTPQKYQVWGQRLFTGFWIIIIGIFLFRSSSEAYENLKTNRQPSSAYDHYSMDMYEFIRENTATDSIIVFFKPRAMRLFTDRDSYMALTCNELTRGDYVVINKIAENSQVPEDKVDECGLPLQSVFESKRFLVFKLLK
ncbi:MAG: glycosyltransferase family 39 protein [Anaerolineales bacterium]